MKYFPLSCVLIIFVFATFILVTGTKEEEIKTLEGLNEICARLCSENENIGPLSGLSSYCTNSFKIEGAEGVWVCFPMDLENGIKSINFPCKIDCQYKFLQLK